jgi:maltose/moltooligosaccharide transporter
MPHSPSLWFAAGLLWILDASINISMEPFRAFVGDMLPESQIDKGYTTQSMLIGIGNVIAALLPTAIIWAVGSGHVEPGSGIPPYLLWLFSPWEPSFISLR